MYLTKNELEIMDTLWREERPLSRGEILSLSVDKTWMDSSIHILLNSMLKKGAIAEAGFVKCGKTCGRVYKAAATVEEYYASTFVSTKKEPDFVKLTEAYIARYDISVAKLNELEKLIKAEKQSRKQS